MPAFAKVFDNVKDHVSQSSPDPGVSLRGGGLGSQVPTAPSSASLLVLELPSACHLSSPLANPSTWCLTVLSSEGGDSALSPLPSQSFRLHSILKIDHFSPHENNGS